MWRWLQVLGQALTGKAKKPVRGFWADREGSELVAALMLTNQGQDFAWGAKYVRNGQSAMPDAGTRLVVSHTLPAGSTVAVRPDGRSIHVSTGATPGLGQIRGTMPVNGQPVEAVLEIDVAGGAVVGEFTALGPPVDE